MFTDFINRILGAEKERGFLGNILAALLGIVTPFCSCSAVPVSAVAPVTVWHWGR